MKRKIYNNYSKHISKRFGHILKKWREDLSLTQDEAAKRLGINCKCPAAYLSQIENAHKAIPGKALLKVPKVYKQPEELVLKLAYWPQLRLPLLESLIRQSKPKQGIDEYLKELEEELNEKEKKELARYAGFLLIKRRI